MDTAYKSLSRACHAMRMHLDHLGPLQIALPHCWCFDDYAFCIYRVHWVFHDAVQPLPDTFLLGLALKP